MNKCRWISSAQKVECNDGEALSHMYREILNGMHSWKSEANKKRRRITKWGSAKKSDKRNKVSYCLHSSHFIASILSHQIYSCYIQDVLLDCLTEPIAILKSNLVYFETLSSYTQWRHAGKEELYQMEVNPDQRREKHMRICSKIHKKICNC